MKAKEYYGNYRKRLLDAVEDLDYKYLDIRMEEAALSLFYGMLNEAEDIIKNRHCQTLEAKLAVVNEMNVRWNCVRDMFSRDLPDGAPNFLDEGGFKKLFADKGYLAVWESENTEESKKGKKGVRKT